MITTYFIEERMHDKGRSGVGLKVGGLEGREWKGRSCQVPPPLSLHHSNVNLSSFIPVTGSAFQLIGFSQHLSFVW
jgi:hypothetical protein